MITVTEARKIVSEQCSPMPATQKPIQEAVGYALAEAVVSRIDIPFFRQSSMDGYAVRYSEQQQALEIVTALPAGIATAMPLAPGTTAKVFTGGPVPDGADTVVQKEWVKEMDGRIHITQTIPEPGMHVRPRGSDMAAGQQALEKGTVLNAMHIGMLAAIGIKEVAVTRKPSVAVIVTGNELVQPGEPLHFGQVYESNAYALRSILQQTGISNVAVTYAKDDPVQTRLILEAALESSDMVLLTGGVSVGDYDYVAAACADNGVVKHFHGVSQRPGKPLYFGTFQNKPVFGLPGNPSSVLSCFYQYVLPAIRKLSGIPLQAPVKAPLSADFEKKPPLTFFLKGMLSEGAATVLPGQASYQLHAFAQANCWIELPLQQTHFEAGTEVIVHPFI